MKYRRVAHEPCASRGECYHVRGGRLGGPRGGRTQGRKNIASGQIRTLGLKQGKKNAESGHMRALGLKQGRLSVESGRLKRIASLGGLVQGRKNVESGQLARIHDLPQSKEAYRLHGQKMVESGVLDRAINVSLHRRDPTAPEAALYRALEDRGIRYEREVGLGPDAGHADVMVGDIIGELDAGGHGAFGNYEYQLERDRLHDALRTARGFTVIRDDNPERLAESIAAVWQERMRESIEIPRHASRSSRGRPEVVREHMRRRTCP